MATCALSIAQAICLLDPNKTATRFLCVLDPSKMTVHMLSRRTRSKLNDNTITTAWSSKFQRQQLIRLTTDTLDTISFTKQLMVDNVDKVLCTLINHRPIFLEIGDNLMASCRGGGTSVGSLLNFKYKVYKLTINIRH